jgi:hypothetical protein
VLRYCAACGQRRLTSHDLTLRGFAHETFQELTSIDGRLWNTVVTLVIHPGKLARDYFDGRGGRYMKPLSLFVLLNLVFFLVQPHTGLMQWHLRTYLGNDKDFGAMQAVNVKRLDRAFESEAQRERYGNPPRPAQVESAELFEAHFEDALQDLKKSMLIIGIPVFALVLSVLYAFQHRRFAEHLVFSSHFWAFFLVFMTFVTPLFQVIMPVVRALHASSAVAFLQTERGLVFIMFLGLGAHLYFAIRRMYGGSALGGVLRATVLFTALEAFIFVFAQAMFGATLLAL